MRIAFATQHVGMPTSWQRTTKLQFAARAYAGATGCAIRNAAAAIIVLAVMSARGAPLAQAQLQSLVDEIVVTTAAANKPKKPATGAGAGANVLANRASLRQARPIPGAPGAPSMSVQRLPPAMFSPTGRDGAAAPVVRLAQGLGAAELPAPIYGPLEIPAGDEEGPGNGLTLDQAIERLVRENYDLRSLAFEIPQARADVLTAGLRANPFVFGTASSYPYQPYSPSRPGENTYSMTVIQPIDVNRKRSARIDVATRARQVLEAQYQDAVRIEIDNLYNAFLDVVAAREAVRYARAGMAGLESVLRTARGQLDSGAISQQDYERVENLLDSADMQLEQAKFSQSQAKLALAALINVPASEAETIEVRGSLRDSARPPPQREELLAIAASTRPDLNAFRLGVRRAQADVRLSQKERFPDAFVLYSPYEYRNNAPTGGQSVASFSVAAMATVPLFNRNQGAIRRAELNVEQTRMESQALGRKIDSEVKQAENEYAASRAVVERMERVILPRGMRIRDAERALFERQEKSALDFLNAQREYNAEVFQYRQALIRHRRSMLRLNTAVGERILP
ncbi:MAG TPA: TolC family protein [Pirellulales bacterium]|nr:TolC family protein [Pirellulales bacterium]